MTCIIYANDIMAVKTDIKEGFTPPIFAYAADYERVSYLSKFTGF